MCLDKPALSYIAVENVNWNNHNAKLLDNMLQL